MKQVRLRNSISLAMNLLLFILVLLSLAWFFLPDGAQGVGNMNRGGVRVLIYFTVDSNILAALACLLLIPFNLKSIRRGEDMLPRWALLLKMIGTVAVTLTFAVVMLYFVPLVGPSMVLTGANLPLHLLCPLLAIASFCFFERGLFFTKRQMLLGIVPAVLYGIVYLVQVVFLENWEDFYAFNVGGLWYVTIVAIPAVNYLFALGLRAVHNKFDKQPANKIGSAT
ncbi:MAG: hypothetical protein IJG45_03005 [Oscillospiraceae bacterium]|nr:hypothetical protein [Oscillospiraceae bacterium]